MKSIRQIIASDHSGLEEAGLIVNTSILAPEKQALSRSRKYKIQIDFKPTEHTGKTAAQSLKTGVKSQHFQKRILNRADYKSAGSKHLSVKFM